ncbi:transposase [Streptomyces sp. TBY4]|uniref:transposase n=1 Tax=Streptomyces sp. TBY4 TaxID=2962030 RepID=UPI0020B736D2|nr:transposase [Streptomyces sp. TBY4]MCP3760699.1 transposase [Streptomyces sp. TBY4]
MPFGSPFANGSPKGCPVDEDIARLTPLKFARINFHGRYSFALPAEVRGGQLRSTRKPEGAGTTN